MLFWHWINCIFFCHFSAINSSACLPVMKIATEYSPPSTTSSHPSFRHHQSSWWGAEAPPYPREREDEEEDDAEGWGPKPELFVRWQKLSNTTIAITHSPSLSDYTDHYTAVVVCVGVCLRGVGGGVEFGGVANVCVCGGGNCRRRWTRLQPAPLHVQHAVKAADCYHCAYVTDNSCSSRASSEVKPAGHTPAFVWFYVCVLGQGWKENEATPLKT